MKIKSPLLFSGAKGSVTGCAPQLDVAHLSVGGLALVMVMVMVRKPAWPVVHCEAAAGALLVPSMAIPAFTFCCTLDDGYHGT